MVNNLNAEALRNALVVASMEYLRNTWKGRMIPNYKQLSM